MSGRQSRTLLIFILLTSFTTAWAIEQRVIYGEDDRLDYYEMPREHQRLAAATLALVRASNLMTVGSETFLRTNHYGSSLGLCSTERFYDQPTLPFCSGFLVAPDIVVTAGHCVHVMETCQSTRFVFGYHVSAPNVSLDRLPSDWIYSCRELIHSHIELKGADFSVIRLDRPVTQAQPLRLRTDGTSKPGDELLVTGYPSGLPVKSATNAHVREVTSSYLVANLDTFGVNSGSPVFNARTLEVEGILVRGERDFVLKDGCRVSNRCGEKECRGEDVTLIQHILPFLNP